MDHRRITSSSASLPIHDHNRTHSCRPSSSRSAGRSFASMPAPMAIPNASHEEPPPPLPPPRFIDELAAGSDPGWAWGNESSEGQFGKSKGSSVSASNFPKSWGSTKDERRPSDHYESRRRESSISTVMSPTTDSDRRYDLATHKDEGYYSLSGPGNLNSQ